MPDGEGSPGSNAPGTGSPGPLISTHVLRTERLALVALTPELARAALEDRAKLGRILGARVPQTWPGADFTRMLPHIARGAEGASPGAEPTRLIVHAADETLIGETGFHGPPDASGTVEVGYSIVPAYRGRGLATEATRTLIQDAIARQTGIRRITAECLDDNTASLRVLEKLGMRQVGSSGATLRFELLPSSRNREER
jgi:ribosomal-protein-alanine N-acetyltransferase